VVKKKMNETQKLFNPKAFKYPQLPKDLRIKIMSDFMPLPELLRLSMTSKRDQQLLDEVISTTAKANTKFRVAGIDAFTHRGFDSAVFLKKKGIDVPKDKIRPYSDKYYAQIAANHANSTQSCRDYTRELVAAELFTACLDDDAYADYWDEFIDTRYDRFPNIFWGYAPSDNLGLVLLPSQVKCCCTSGGACGEHCSCFHMGQCFYMCHACDHFDFDEHHMCYVLGNGVCVCHRMHGSHGLGTYV